MVKNPSANAGDTRDVGLISGSGRSPGVGNGNPLQYSCLENPMDRGAWRATVHGKDYSRHHVWLFPPHQATLQHQQHVLEFDSICAPGLFVSDSLHPIDCSLPGSSVCGVLQARILEWTAISSSRRSSRPRDQTRISCVSCIGRWVLYNLTQF